MRKDAPLSFDVPSADRDNPGWVKVGVIAVVGFVIGIGWPRLMGVRLGPSAPGEAASALAASSASAMPPAEPAPPASAVAAPSAALNVASNAAPAAQPRVVDSVATPVTIALQKTSVLSCKVDGGDVKKGKECGSVSGLDQLVNARLRKLSTCAAAERQSGKLSVVVTADFAASKVTWDIGKSSNVGNVDAIGGCLKTLFQGTSLSGVAHEHLRYTVAYAAMISGGDAKGTGGAGGTGASSTLEGAEERAPAASTPIATSAGETSIGWDVALVRDTPKVGQIVARLPRGTKVKVGASKDGWYSIKYGDGFAEGGWVYRGALGR